jgi:hypothetical protein
LRSRAKEYTARKKEKKEKKESDPNRNMLEVGEAKSPGEHDALRTAEAS